MLVDDFSNTPSTSSVGSRPSSASAGGKRPWRPKLLRSMASALEIMVSHAWTVGGLIEMDPRDDQIMKKKQQEGGCLLGYNENMGARIYVKLRKGRRQLS